jgi:hypothetical protein
MPKPKTRGIHKQIVEITHLAMSRSVASWIVGFGCHTDLRKLAAAADCFRNVCQEDHTMLILKVRRRATPEHFYMDHVCPMLAGCHRMAADCYYMAAGCHRMVADCRTLAVLDLGWHLDILNDCPHAEHHMRADYMRCR